MNCDRKRLSYYIDGELSAEETGQVEAHLKSCSRCAADLAAYRRIDEHVRHLKTNPPPNELARRVYRRLEERSRSRLRWVWAHPVLGPSIRLTAAFALAVSVAGGLFTLGQLRAGPPPSVTAAFVVQEAPDSLDGLRIELVFDRAVAPDSLAEAVAIEPSLPLAHRVRENRVELTPQTPVAPGNTYSLTVDKVRDQAGRVQSDPVVFSLVAGPMATLLQESRPLEPPGATASEPGATAPVAKADPAQDTQQQPSTETASPGSRTRQIAASASQPASGRDPSRPLPALQPHLASTPIGDASAVLDAYPDLQRRLGLNSGPERRAQVTEQAFQGGAMLIRHDTNQVIVLVRSSGRWLGFPNPWRPGEVLASAGARPPGTLEPLRGFGKVWREQPAVKLQLGWPVYEERSAGGSLQAFQNGTLLRSAHGIAYVLFNDGSWRSLPASKL
jgi:Putative zinc-finger